MQDSWDIQGRPLWWKCVLSCVRLFVTPQTVACLASFSKEFSRQEYWSGLPLLGSSQPKDRMHIFFIDRWVLTPEPLQKPGQPLGIWINSPVFFLYITRKILKKNILYIAWEVSTKSILYSMTVFYRKHSLHWLLHHLLHPPPFCRHFHRVMASRPALGKNVLKIWDFIA